MQYLSPWPKRVTSMYTRIWRFKGVRGYPTACLIKPGPPVCCYSR
jgi:hypothetical protein